MAAPVKNKRRERNRMTLREILDEIEHDSDSDLVHSESESEVDSGDELESDSSEYDPVFHGQNYSNDGDA